MTWGQDQREHRSGGTTTQAAHVGVAASARGAADFLSVMSHEIRTPLNGVLGMLRLLSQSELAPAQREQLDLATRSAVLLLSVTNDILDLAAMDAGRAVVERAPFDLVPLVEDIVELAKPAAPAGVDVSVFSGGLDGVRVVGDAMRLRRILGNLVGNAVKFTEQGAVHVSLAQVDSSRGPSFRVTVSDTGPGIPVEHQRSVFEPFSFESQPPPRRRAGTGLGLPVSVRLAALMGGSLTLARSDARGTTFVLDLPFDRVHAPGRGTGPAATRSAGACRVKARLLLVDDGHVNRLVASAMLRQLGCDVAMANNGEEAVQAIAREPFDLVFMDCQMPVLDGFEATRRVRASGGRQALLPIVALTAGTYERDRERSLAAGMNDHLSKPVDEGILLAALERWLPPGSVCAV